jgi:SdrD B-like domain
MRGSLVVLALAITPLCASVSQAQRGPHWQRRYLGVARHEDGRGRSDDKKCEDRKRGNPSDNALNHRADPRLKGNKDCDLSTGNGGGDQPPPPPPPSGDTLGHTQIQGSLFFDVDHDGAFGPDEVGLAGWTVQVTGPMNASAVTDGNGAYTISGLTAGTYTVCVMAPMGWSQTSPGTGFGLPTCSNGTVGFSLEAPEVVGDTGYSGVDFGFVSM